MEIGGPDFHFNPALPAVYVDWEKYQEKIGCLVEQLEKRYKPDVLVGVFQGGWIVAQSVADSFPDARIMGAVRVAGRNRPRLRLVSTDGRSLPPSRGIRNGRVLLVDEVIDSGRTIQFCRDMLKTWQPIELRVGCMYLYARSQFQPDFASEVFTTARNYVLPWRMKRDLCGIVYNLLHTRPMRADEIVTGVERTFRAALGAREVMRALQELEMRCLAGLRDGVWSLLR
jgi:hypoxanthine phosphoribosyltransferase